MREPSPSVKENPVFVLGMHRSGTSCLAGCIEEAGFYLGNVNRSAPFNKKGNNESRIAMELNDEILHASGGDWRSPPQPSAIVSRAEHINKARNIVETYPNNHRWALKDPRLLFTISVWRRVCSPSLVGTFRHPLEVSASLVRRSNAWGQPMSASEAIDLWLKYNDQLVSIWCHDPFPIVHFASSEYQIEVRNALRLLGAKQHIDLNFFDPEVFNEESSEPVPLQCQKIWNHLLEAQRRTIDGSI